MPEEVDVRKRFERPLVRAIEGRTDLVAKAGRNTIGKATKGPGARPKAAEGSAPNTTMARR